ncbi:MAG: hypothetical protein AAF990_26430, partial [Bacteroidota bacterium]
MLKAKDALSNKQIVSSQKTLVLASSDVQKIIHHHGLDEVMDALINRLERAMKIFDDQLIDIPARSG